MSEALYATARRMPISITLHDPTSTIRAFVQSLESSKKPGLQTAVANRLKPYLFHVVELARQLFLEINGGELNLDCSALVLPFYRELERRADEGESHVRERMQLFRAQARSITLLGLLAARARAAFCAETVPENMADLETIANELKTMGYSLDVALIRRLEEASMGKQPVVEDFRPQPALAELFFFPLDPSWIGIGIEIPGGDHGDWD
ncbi:hypothetical protein B0H14DRAFT_2928464, partial [Mycena olivaceomarginata]